MLQQPTLKHIELFAIGREHENQSWSAFLGPMFEPVVIANLIFDDGTVGVAGTTMWTEHEFDKSLFHSATLAAPFLIGHGLYDWPQVLAKLNKKYLPLKQYVLSLFDIAWHDAKGKRLGIPIYQMMGVAQYKIKAYASSPVFDQPEQYIDYCKEKLAENFTAIKIHGRGIFAEDMEIVKALQTELGDSGLSFNLDADANYSYQQALKMGRLLDAYNWDFFEEPMPDSDLEGYRRLASNIDTDLVNGGNSVTDLYLLNRAISQGCWGRLRFDVNSVGGFHTADLLMSIAEVNRMKVELQCWGNTLSQAPNLHLMLSHSNCEFFELVTPYEKYEFGCHTGFRPDSDGFIHPTKLPGLGIELDWDTIEPHIYLKRTF